MEKMDNNIVDILEGDEGEKTPQELQTEPQTGESVEDEKKYSDADLDRIIAKKISKERERMRRALNKEEAESELDKRERNITRRELQADARERLISGGYPSMLADIMEYGDKEAHQASYEKVTKIFTEALKSAVVDQFKTGVPKIGTSNSLDNAIREAFAAKRVNK